MSLQAYYYGFSPTEDAAIDGILAAVARAGKAFHDTSQWNDNDWDGLSPVESIQRAAIKAADELAALRELEREARSWGCDNKECAICLRLAALDSLRSGKAGT